eukprot:3301500-Amphidinium_carterae.1
MISKPSKRRVPKTLPWEGVDRSIAGLLQGHDENAEGSTLIIISFDATHSSSFTRHKDIC